MFRVSKHWAPLPLRIMLGVGFFYHGWPKVFSAEGHQGFAGMLGGLGVPAPETTAWLVGLAEIVGGFPSQQARGVDYFNVVSNLQNVAATSGSHPYVGTEWWQFVDNWGEKLNWGLVSSRDNVYDGKEAVNGPGTDPFGFPTGGEVGNYGDTLTSIEAANAAWINNH